MICHLDAERKDRFWSLAKTPLGSSLAHPGQTSGAAHHSLFTSKGDFEELPVTSTFKLHTCALASVQMIGTRREGRAEMK